MLQVVKITFGYAMQLNRNYADFLSRLIKFAKLEWLNKKLPLLFVLSAFSCCMALATLVPLGQVPDASAHIARAAALTRGVVFGSVEDVTAPDRNIPAFQYSGLKVDSGLMSAVEGSVNYPKELFDKPKPRLTPPEIRAEFNSKWSNHLTFFACPNALQYFPIFYIPSAIGIGVGHTVGLSPYVSVILARILNIFAFIAVGYLAIKLARYGKIVIFAILTFPTTLYLTSGMNQDGLCIAFACLAAAITTMAIEDPDKVKAHRLRWIIGGLLAAVITSKPPYMPLLLLLLLPLGEDFIKRCKQIVVCALPGLAWFTILLLCYHTNFLALKPYHPGIWWNGAHNIENFKIASDNIHVLVQHPLRFWSVFSNTISLIFFPMVMAIIAEFGYYNILAPSYWYMIYVLSLGLMIFSVLLHSDKMRLKYYDSSFAFFAFLITTYTIVMSIYISWENVGDTFASGFNGRYMLPILPFLIFAWSGAGRISCFSKYLSRYLQLPIVFAATMNCAIVPMCVMYNLGFGFF